MPSLQLKTDHAGKPVVRLHVSVGIARVEYFQKYGIMPPVPRQLRALVDTGASTTMVEERYLRELGLSSIAEEDVHTASTGSLPLKRPIYAVEIALAEDVTGTLAEDLHVIGAPDLGSLGVEMLLGRDVLMNTILTYNGPAGEFRLEFPG